MSANKHSIPLAISLLRNKLVFCSSSSPSPVSLDFLATTVRDLEVVNQAELNAQIKAFISNHQIKPGPAVIVLAGDVYFEKNLTEVPPTDRSTEIQNFIDTVPLASVSSKVFKSGTQELLVVINRDLFDSLREALELAGFSVIAAVPELALGKIGPVQNITSESCRLILKKIDFLLENSFLADSDSTGLQQKEQRFLKKHQTMFVILFFITMLACGVIIYFITKRPAQNITTQPTVPVMTITPTLTPSPTQTADLAGLSIEIRNASGVSGAASLLEKNLKTLNPALIKTGNSSVASGKTLIVFSPIVSSPARELVLQTVKVAFPDVTTQESSTPNGFAITIILYKSIPVQTTP